ncbi:MAG TPA: DUF3592 domain-containing protein [Chitinophagaceae bacterium]|nr:DUF3592 domain-containing protein [Chitinophagaceae bacterium]
MSELVTLIIPLFSGIVLIILAMTLLAKRNKIIQNGVEVEGVIFDFETSDTNNNYLKYPIIRFVTKEGSWITKTADYSLPFLKRGQKVIVIYNKDNHEEFIFKTSIDVSKLAYLFLILGIIILLIGLLLAYRYLIK